MAEEEFEHKPEVWTVGDLRAVLADVSIPDDMPLHFMVAERPGGDFADTQIAYSAGLGEGWDERTGKTFAVFQVSLEFPPGTYYRTVPDED